MKNTFMVINFKFTPAKINIRSSYPVIEALAIYRGVTYVPSLNFKTCHFTY